MRSLILKHPVACFIGLTFILSILIGLPVKLFVLDKLSGDSELGVSYFSKSLVVYGPALSAIIITFFTSGAPGVASLLGRLKPYTIHVIWWIGLPISGMVITTLAFIAGGFTWSELISYVVSASPLLLLFHFAAAFVLIGIGEELGWRGWLLPKLAKGRTIIRATMLTAFVWAAWHFPIYLSNEKISILFVLLPLVISVLLSRLWDHVGGNVFVLAIAHASLEFPFAFFVGRIGNTHDDRVAKAVAALSAVYLVLALAVYYFERKRFNAVITPPNERLPD